MQRSDKMWIENVFGDFQEMIIIYKSDARQTDTIMVSEHGVWKGRERERGRTIHVLGREAHLKKQGL